MADPTLILDRRTDVGVGPGMHAIFIGVSDYANLTHPVDDPPGEGMAALQKLRSPALSAWRMAEKLMALDSDKRLIRPLKTVRLLIAPTAEELAAEPALVGVGGGKPDIAAIRTSLREWRKDIALHRDEQALFHFSGHGVRRSAEEAILLAADFDPAGDVLLENAFNLRSVFNGMAPSDKFPDIGRTQFYFVDACRDKPDALDKLDNTDTPKIFDGTLNTFDDRKAPIIFATRMGGTAAAYAGRPTEFTQAMLWAMDNGATDRAELDGVKGTVWVISIDSMKAGLSLANKKLGERAEFTGMMADAVFGFRRDAPPMKVSLSFAPDALHDRIGKVALYDVKGKLVTEIARADPASYWEAEIKSGIYMLSVEPNPADAFPPFSSSEPETLNLRRKMPWTITLGDG